ncbi:MULTISPECIES: hypothetical protein [unclassified Pseudomonas]|jgi:hypothetical protein|uniref:hypothetical protein n=1 Tax=unclassified Pseudomonas TaxID=196821 RepID=UPI000C825C99|nr:MULTISPECIES: hypothetical protein [unclassified Pseudomonas]MDX9671271.1 hypothetical protein [Pseudomonas sp. P8_250]PMQ13642.1 hypothetical protein PseAD21_03835 [Pseudomonas sp. AD21]WPN34749.1 hypothetical protein QMK53_21440 [Pseudomonas sp. P8_139]WPN43451.1 hypothetical protein QMK55_09935 [Pseudomonas sp. P8_229]
MKRLLWILFAIPLLLIVAWRLCLPVDLSSCANNAAAQGPLSVFIRDYFDRNARTDWRDMDDRFDVLSTPEGQKIAGRPQAYVCEALQILQSPAFSQSEKIFTTALMFQLPISQYMGFMDRSHQLYAKDSIDREVMKLVVLPRGTAINYWWLPAWRQRFTRDAPSVLDANLINHVLSGRYWFDYPGAGF